MSRARRGEVALLLPDHHHAANKVDGSLLANLITSHDTVIISMKPEMSHMLRDNTIRGPNVAEYGRIFLQVLG